MKLGIYRMYPDVKLPIYGSDDAACMDLCAYLPAREDPPSYVEIGPGNRRCIPTGIKSVIPSGWRVSFRPRSGLAVRSGIAVMGGTIDADYRGEWQVILVNHSGETARISHGERICQFSLEEAPKIEIVELKESDLSYTARASGGFGSTGV